MTKTLTTEAMQEIYEAAVHSEATGDDQDAHFELLCKLEDVGGTGATIRKLIDMVRAAMLSGGFNGLHHPDYHHRVDRLPLRTVFLCVVDAENHSRLIIAIC